MLAQLDPVLVAALRFIQLALAAVFGVAMGVDQGATVGAVFAAVILGLPYSLAIVAIVFFFGWQGVPAAVSDAEAAIWILVTLSCTGTFIVSAVREGRRFRQRRSWLDE